MPVLRNHYTPEYMDQQCAIQTLIPAAIAVQADTYSISQLLVIKLTYFNSQLDSLRSHFEWLLSI